MEETKLGKFDRQFKEANILMFRLRVAERKRGLNEAERLLYRQVKLRQRSLKNAVKALTNKK